MTLELPSLGSRLAAAEAKIGRADQHLRALRQSLGRFRDRDPFVVGGEVSDSQLVFQPATLVPGAAAERPSGLVVPVGSSLLANSCIYSVVLTPRLDAPTLRWGTIIGDVVHNLASTLDNLVWELAEINPNRVLPSATDVKGIKDYERKQRSLAFPYCEDGSRWEEVCRNNLALVAPHIYPTFEAAQPFNSQQQDGQDPEHHWLRVLRSLWNRDKHRTINVAWCSGDCRGISMRLQNWASDPPMLRSELLVARPRQAIQGPTEVALVRVHFPQPVRIPLDGTVRVDLHVDGNFALGMVFGSGVPAEGSDVIETMVRVRNEVVRILNLFE